MSAHTDNPHFNISQHTCANCQKQNNARKKPVFTSQGDSGFRKYLVSCLFGLDLADFVICNV